MNSPGISQGGAINFVSTGACNPDATAVFSGPCGRHKVRPLPATLITEKRAAETGTLLSPSLQATEPAPPDLAPDAAPLPFASYVHFTDPALRINYLPAPDKPLESLIASPRVRLELGEDTWWRDQSKEPATLDKIQQLLQERRTVEARAGEFAFAPLLTTLKDMQSFIRHIQAGNHFCGALTPDEVSALDRLASQTTTLVDARKAPYKKTFRLALSLMILCELITCRLVLRPLLTAQPDLESHIESYVPALKEQQVLALLAALPFDNSFHRQMAADLLPHNILALPEVLLETLHNQNLLLYPSFHPLTVADFCRFSHLPVHPVGLTMNYAQAADGRLMSPLSFAVHDLLHMLGREDLPPSQTQSDGSPESVFVDCHKRLALRCMLLNTMPDPLAGLVHMPALELLLFELLHEFGPRESARRLAPGPSCFFHCLRTVTKPRREERLAYEDVYRNITDSQAAMTALWATRVWQGWRTSGFQPLKPGQLTACMRQFTDTDAPCLEQHLMFIKQHRGALRWLFVRMSNRHTLLKAGGHQCSNTFTIGRNREYLRLFLSHDPDSGLRNLDNTDLAYFLVLSDPQWRDRIKEETGACVPAVTWCAPDTSRPMDIQPAPGTPGTFVGPETI
ncbi:MAG: hypothetical protein OXC07_03280 [Kistimonas sp.]|nr:hypothetical protein [Kistimonas sp.]